MVDFPNKSAPSPFSLQEMASAVKDIHHGSVYILSIVVSMCIGQLPLQASSVILPQSSIEFSKDDFGVSSRAEKDWAIWGKEAEQDTLVWATSGITEEASSGLYTFDDTKNDDHSITWRIVVPEDLTIKEVEFFFDRVQLNGDIAPKGDDQVIWEYSVNSEDWTPIASWENRTAEATEAVNHDGESVLAEIAEPSNEVYIRIRKSENAIVNDGGYFHIWSNFPQGGMSVNSKVSVTVRPSVEVKKN